MNREIKFRAWVAHDWDDDDTPKDFKMVEWYYDFFNETSPVTMYGGDFPCHEEPDVVLMQFTGRQDSEGTDIYDLDVIEMDFEIQAIVRWDVKYDAWTMMTRDTAMKCVGLLPATKGKIIGNIFENPELGFG